MICSQNEIVAVIYKAAIGSGLAVGIAQDLAQAGALLCAEGKPGVALAIESFDEDVASWCSAFDLLACGSQTEVTVVLEAAADVLWALGVLAGRAYGITYHHEVASGTAVVTCVAGAPAAWIAGSTGAVEVAEADLERAHALAHKTYVPATEASRISGAGAGLTDND